MNTITDQLKQMENDRKKLVKRVVSAKTDFELEQAIQDLKAHDIEVGKLLRLKLPTDGQTPADYDWIKLVLDTEAEIHIISL